MATILSLTRDGLIDIAVGTLGVLADGQSPSAGTYTLASTLLNTTIARFRTKGLPLWKRVEYSWTPTTTEYLIGIGQTLNTAFPLKLIQAYRESASDARVPIDIVADYDFNTYPTNDSGSPPLQVTYTPFVNYGRIRFWPGSLATNTEEVTLVYHAPYDYLDSSTDTLDLPEEWYDAIIYDLAVKLSPHFGIPTEDRKQLRAEAKEYLMNAEDFGFENASLYITPGRQP